MKKVLAVLLAVAIVSSLLAVTASAAVKRATRVNIVLPRSTVAVDRTIYNLEVKIYPSDVEYDKVVWYTDDYDIIDVERYYGDITGLKPGTATVTVEVYMTDTDEYNENGTVNKNYNKSIRVGSASRTITVTGSTTSGSTTIQTRDVDENGNVVKTGGNGAATSLTVIDAVKKALVAGKTTSATFKDYDSVSAYALQAAAAAMKGGMVTLNFDTTNGSSIEGRLSINPNNASNLKNDVNLGVYTNNTQTYKAKGVFEKYFKNNVVVVKTAQAGNYGMGVKIAVKVQDDVILKSKNLRLYTYDVTTNKYREIKDAGLRVDSNGFVHFTTSVGGYLVISNGVLAKK